MMLNTVIVRKNYGSDNQSDHCYKHHGSANRLMVFLFDLYSNERRGHSAWPKNSIREKVDPKDCCDNMLGLRLWGQQPLRERATMRIPEAQDPSSSLIKSSEFLAQRRCLHIAPLSILHTYYTQSLR